MRLVRRGLVAIGLILALMPLSAFAADGNQAVIEAARAEKAWLQTLTAVQQGVLIGEQQIANARAMAKMMTWDANRQAEIPNAMQRYSEYCSGAISVVQSNLANAQARAADKPWDVHMQDELANAIARSHMLWDMVGDDFPGNPYASRGTEVRPPSQAPIVGDDEYVLAVDDEVATVADDFEVDGL